jgi:hypothetical protein
MRVYGDWTKELEFKILQRTTHHLFSTLEAFSTTSIFLEQLGFQMSSGTIEFVAVAEHWYQCKAPELISIQVGSLG